MAGPSDRRALQSVAAQFFVNGAVLASFVPRLPEIRDRLDLNTAELGLLLTIGGAVGLSGSVAVSPLVGRFGTRQVIIIGGLLLVSALALVGVADHPALLLLGLAGIATFDTIVDVPMNMQGSWINARARMPIMNRLHGLWSLGTVIGGIVSSRIAAAGISLPVHMLSASAVLALTLIFVGRGLLTTDEPSAEAERDTGADGSRARRRSLRAGLAMFAVAGGTAVAMEMTASDWAAFRLTDDFDATAGLAGLAFVANTGGMTTGRLLGDWVESRIGPQRLVNTAIAIAAIGLTLASFAPDRWLTLMGYGLTGIGIAPFMPRLYDDAVKMPGRPGAGVGALTAGIRLTALATPVVVGALAASSLSVGQATAAITLPAVVAFALLTRQRSRSINAA